MSARAVVHGFLTVLLTVLAFLPHFMFRCLVLPCAWGVFMVSRKLRCQAMESLGMAYGDALSQRDKRNIAGASFFNLFLGLADCVYLIARPGRSLNMFALEGVGYLKNAREGGKGAVLAIAHFGPFAAMLVRLLYEDFRVKVVMRPPKNGVWRDELISRPGRFAPQPVYSTPLRACVTACSQALKDNDLLVMPVDQNYGGAGRIFVDFFGRKAGTAAGPAIYAWKTGAPLLTAFARPPVSGSRRWTIVLQPVALDRSLPEYEAVVRATQEMTSRVEAFARQYPAQWSWMHRRWKAEPRAAELVRVSSPGYNG